MDSEVEQEITKILMNKLNPWWRNIKIDTPKFHRADYYYLKYQIHEDKALTLVGPRQIGKTTIIKQLIQDLIEEKQIDSTRIIYADLADTQLRLLSENIVNDILSIYQKNILHKDFSELKEDVFIFFDEVQKDINWAESLKSYIDHYKHLKILCTGSSSLEVTQKSRETLPGRAIPQIMLPLKFVDYIGIRHNRDEDRLDMREMREFSKQSREEFIKAIEKEDIEGFVEYIDGRNKEWLSYETKVQAKLETYMSRGGYPAIALENTTAQCQRLLNTYATDVIAKDMALIGGVRNFDTAEKVLYLLAKMSGNELNKKTITDRIKGSNFNTVNKYISMFKEVFLISEISIYSGSMLGSSKNPKIYFQDVGMRNAICGVLDSPFSDKDKGHLAETLACDHIKRLAFKINENAPGHIYCYKDESGKEKRGEIDFVVKLPKYKMSLPIENKYRKTLKGFETFDKFLKEQKQGFGLVLTRDVLKYERDKAFVPLWMFLLMS